MIVHRKKFLYDLDVSRTSMYNISASGEFLFYSSRKYSYSEILASEFCSSFEDCVSHALPTTYSAMIGKYKQISKQALIDD